MKVFLSHSSADKVLARRLAGDLQAANVDVWLDQWEIRVGEMFEQKIEQGLHDSQFVIVLLTRQSVGSNWVEREWRHKFEVEARSERIAIIPVRGEVCEIPDFLAQRSYADIAGGGYPLGFRHLLEILRHYAEEAAIAVPDAELVADDPAVPMVPILTPITLEVGAELIPLFEPDGVGHNRFLDVLARQLRDDLRAEFGFPFPGIRVRGVTSEMPPRAVLISIDEVPEAMFELGRAEVLAAAAVDVLAAQGIRAVPYEDVITTLAVSRIDAADRTAATGMGIESWDTLEYIALALRSLIRRQASLFLDMDGVHRLVSSFRETVPELVDATVPAGISWIELTLALRQLVEEGIGIGDMGRILDAVRRRGVKYRESRDTLLLVEQIRHALAEQITMRFTGGRNQLSVLELHREIESQMVDSILQTDGGPYLQLAPEATQAILSAVRDCLTGLGPGSAGVPLLVTDTRIRRFMRRLVSLEFSLLQVLSRAEIAAGVELRVEGVIAFCTGGRPMIGDTGGAGS